jgi:hypothetical protein
MSNAQNCDSYISIPTSQTQEQILNNNNIVEIQL